MISLENTCALCFILLHAYFVSIYWSYLLGILVIYIASILTRRHFRQKVDIGRKGIVVTGCDSGFGHCLAKRLDEWGYTVYAGVLNKESPGAKVLQSRQSDRFHVVTLDVTKDEDVQKVLEYVSGTGQGLWAIVNNAGINFPGDVELATVDQYQRCADVNLYGMIRVIKAFLPLIRKSKGRVINVSSVKGRYSWPCDSVYIVTKHGIETLSDSLRLEMKKFGVHVSVVEPGAYSEATAINSPEQVTISSMLLHTSRLWAVVNNAGINFPGDVELATVDQYKKCADVNLFGMIRVIKAFLPHLRRSKGRIVNMSSVMGRFAWPSGSVYTITKHGTENMSDSLRMELKKFGVKVSVIEPGQFSSATSVCGPDQLKRLKKEIDHMWEQASEDVRQTYGRTYFDAIYQSMETIGTDDGRKLSVGPVINAIEDALINVKPKARYVVGGSSSVVDHLAVLAKIYSFLPEFVSDWIVERLTGCASFPR